MVRWPFGDGSYMDECTLIKDAHCCIGRSCTVNKRFINGAYIVHKWSPSMGRHQNVTWTNYERYMNQLCLLNEPMRIGKRTIYERCVNQLCAITEQFLNVVWARNERFMIPLIVLDEPVWHVKQTLWWSLHEPPLTVWWASYDRQMNQLAALTEPFINVKHTM